MGGIYYESKSFHVLIIIVVLLLFVTGIVLLVRWVIRSTEKNQKNQYGQAPAMYSEQKAFCTGCGKELSACEEFCSVCGKQRTTPAQGAQPTFQQPVYPQMGYVQDAPSGGMTALGFFFPIVGLILYLVWKDQTPLKAHSAGKGALIGVIVWTALSIILAILAYVVPLLVLYSYY